MKEKKFVWWRMCEMYAEENEVAQKVNRAVQ